MYAVTQENRGTIEKCSSILNVRAADISIFVDGNVELNAALVNNQHSLPLYVDKTLNKKISVDKWKIKQSSRKKEHMENEYKQTEDMQQERLELENREQEWIISSQEKIGREGEQFTIHYDTIRFIEDGCLDIYGDMDLTIDKVENFKKTDNPDAYEICIRGQDGENGRDSVFGEDGGDGKPGQATNVNVNIKNLMHHIKLTVIGGKGGDGGFGGRNGDGSTYAKAGKSGRSCRDGMEGEKGEVQKIKVHYHTLKEDIEHDHKAI